MANFAPLINDKPMDPTDERLLYGLDFVDVIDDGGTIVTPTATIEAAGVTAGVTLNNVQIASTTQVLFRPTVSSGQQSNSRWDDDGKRYLVTITIDNATAQTIERSGFLWIAQR